MGKKYLDTKQDTIEAAVLDVWVDAAEEQEAIQSAARMVVDDTMGEQLMGPKATAAAQKKWEEDRKKREDEKKKEDAKKEAEAKKQAKRDAQIAQDLPVAPTGRRRPAGSQTGSQTSTLGGLAPGTSGGRAGAARYGEIGEPVPDPQPDYVSRSSDSTGARAATRDEPKKKTDDNNFGDRDTSKKDQEIFKILMGSDVSPRKDFISDHALEVSNLDI